MLSDRQKQALHYLSSPEEWCYDSLLPLTRWKDDKKEFGFLLNNRQINFEVLSHHQPTLYLGNIFALEGDRLIQQLMELPKKTYASFEEMVLDGWEVD